MKQTMKFAAVVAIALSTVLVGCKKDDVDAPVVTLLGSASESKVLNETYTDAGATAKDERDGDLTSSIVSDAATAVKKDAAGTYTVTYTATDAAGNIGTATRAVAVKNAADNKAGNYNVVTVEGGSTYNSTDVVAASGIKNNRVLSASFTGLVNTEPKVNIDIDGNNVTVASQAIVAGPSGSRNNATVSGTGTVTSTGFTVNYTVKVTGQADVTGVSTYTKQ